MKILKITAMLLLFCNIAMAEEKLKQVAIGAIGDEPANTRTLKGLSGWFRTAIANSNKYIAVDRSEEILKQLGKEHRYTRGGAAAKYKELGQQLEADLLCIIESTEVMPGVYQLEVNLIDVETAVIVPGGSGIWKGKLTDTDIDVVIGYYKKATEELSKQILDNKVNSNRADGYTIYLDISLKSINNGNKLKEKYFSEQLLAEMQEKGCGCQLAKEKENADYLITIKDAYIVDKDLNIRYAPSSGFEAAVEGGSVYSPKFDKKTNIRTLKTESNKPRYHDDAIIRAHTDLASILAERLISMINQMLGKTQILDNVIKEAFNTSSSSGSNPSGPITDFRDNKTYNTVKIGTLIWMAENLNYKTGNSLCYDNDEFNCKKYGRLYDWKTAMRACPKGWYLPGNSAWNDLMETVGGVEDAGRKLKSKTQWDGIDGYGWSAIPSGGYFGWNNDYSLAGEGGVWWSASYSYNMNENFYWVMNSNDESVHSNVTHEADEDKYSVRCVKD
ncbi:MAG: fibrobacter succinogenes major paralogous domain-containing protein [Fibromonadaceae bacterium]|jgi:uncharacterized protein (TIGR02145 family)|nr:fibrobacter succinogenes major paralogous domain-containing protein [Fibromonadaceae bacterium]